ncbi:MAG: hypothetical protein L3J07_01495 [Candidatus Magasanikbacteria bacterium]|nr:hypothetical protein [Candidatus Magasanikbacteria bacterium]
MKDIREIFERIKETQRKQKDIKSAYRDALEASSQYKEIADKLSVLKEKKKSIENQIKADFSSEFGQLDNLKEDLMNDKQMLSDIALTTLMKGKPIELKDEYGNDYEPIFSVKFQKI